MLIEQRLTNLLKRLDIFVKDIESLNREIPNLEAVNFPTAKQNDIRLKAIEDLKNQRVKAALCFNKTMEEFGDMRIVIPADDLIASIESCGTKNQLP